MKTFSAKPDSVRRDWYLVNAEGKTLGRLATALALTPSLFRHWPAARRAFERARRGELEPPRPRSS